MAKKKTQPTQNKAPFIIGISLLIVAILFGVIGYSIGHRKDSSTPMVNTPGYIVSDEARNQVTNFYQQYLHPGGPDAEKSRQLYVSKYGDKNLVFYRTYYQHGFDPIVCSTEMPKNVTVTNVMPGAGAEVTARASYPDGSAANITVTLVINGEGFRIDSITCPGDKGNLPPTI